MEQGSLWRRPTCGRDEEMMSAADLQADCELSAPRCRLGRSPATRRNQLGKSQIRSGYGYTIDKQGNVYDSGVGAAIAARGETSGALIRLLRNRAAAVPSADVPGAADYGQQLRLMSALLALKTGITTRKPSYYRASSRRGPAVPGGIWRPGPRRQFWRQNLGGSYGRRVR